MGRPVKMEYACYKGDVFVCMGTAKECADYLGIKEKTFRWYLNPAYHKRLEKRKYSIAPLLVERIEE
jgi:hypothetical protein